jgi:hypothetical protein
MDGSAVTRAPSPRQASRRRSAARSSRVERVARQGRGGRSGESTTTGREYAPVPATSRASDLVLVIRDERKRQGLSERAAPWQIEALVQLIIATQCSRANHRSDSHPDEQLGRG